MSCCLICYRNCDNPSEICNERGKAKVKSDIKRFLKILERYINGGKDESLSSTIFPKAADNVMEAGIGSCRNCHNLMEEFCDIYNVLEETEMILNFKMKCLSGVMECAGDLGKDLDIVAKEMMEWRQTIVAKCNEKIQNSFPKLIINRGLIPANKNLMKNAEPASSDDTVNNQGADVSQETNSVVSAEEIECADCANTFGNEPAYNCFKEDEYDPAQLSSDESSSDSDNDLENIKEELKFDSALSEGFITEEIPQIKLDDNIEENTKHSPVACKTETQHDQRSNASLQVVEDPKRVEGGENFIKCEHCGKLFKNKMHLSMHEWLHNLGKKCICKICNKVLKCQTDLNRHLLTHKTGRNPTKTQILTRNRKELAQAKEAVQSQIQTAQPSRIVVNGQRRYPCGNQADNTQRGFKRCKLKRIPHSKNFMIGDVTIEPIVSIASRSVYNADDSQTGENITTINQTTSEEVQQNSLKKCVRTEPPSHFKETTNQENEGQFDNELISSPTSAAAVENPLPERHLRETDELANEQESSSTPSEAIIEETPQTLLQNMEVVNEASNAISQMGAEGVLEKNNLPNSKTIIPEKKEDVAPKSRTLRSIQSCPICSKTFSTEQKLQAHLTFHLQEEASNLHISGEEESLQLNEVIDDAREKDYDEYNPDELSLNDESESSSSDSESENDFKNSNEEAMPMPSSPSTTTEIFLNKHQTNDTPKDIRQVDFNESKDQKNTEKETEEAATPTETRLGKMSLKKLRKRYAADSEIVEFLTFPCEIEGCNKILRNSKDFQDHKGHHGTFSCSLCPTLFDYAPHLARHELSKHCNKTMTCPREGCNFKGKDARKYNHHVLVSHLNLKLAVRGRKFNCKICKNGFGKMWELRRHFPLCQIAKASPKPKPTVKCDVEGCTKTCHNAAGIWYHKYLKHSKTSLVCQICKKTYSNRTYLNYHVRKSHPNNLTISCVVESCKEKFISELGLDTHVLCKHKNERDKISKLCPHCGKKIFGSRPFQQHLDSHAIPKRYICDMCGKGFKTREQLDTHKLSHSGPEGWQYQCEVCAKKCISKQKLEEHKRTHGNEKPFVCDVCGAKYAHRHNLRIHVNNKHGHLTKDVARHFDKSNLTSRKGVKRKRIEEEEEDTLSSSDSD